MRRAALAAAALAVAAAVAVPVAASASGDRPGTPAGCVPGTVVRDGDARHCELVDDPAVPAPAGWASEAGVSHTAGDATEAPGVADGSWAGVTTEAQEGDAAPGTGTGLDMAALERLGLTADGAGALSYRGVPVRGLVQEHDADVVSIYWSDTGESYLLITDGVVRQVPADEFPELDAL
ncbi:hypothetical protein KQI48_06455 [Cellulomonas hominis]|uniref:hypothetical protein n=1 Tax=Cellulomonas hominis TaxID=156981 RepID=UPI001C0FBF62|nr:hypothetical protein [Cellulomonas hominis]MBU5422302.1 hypothetical protein [Cellulomonas hominis]